MKRLPLFAAIVTSALAVAACGSDGVVGSSQPTPSATPSVASSAGQPETVSVMAAGGIGDILVDSSGMALYTPDQESDGVVHCVAACLSYWIPLAPGASSPTSPAGGPILSVITRPDGAEQVTAGGRPLYTFSLDSVGKVTGDGVSDDFGDQHLTWHAVRADGTTPAATSDDGYHY